MIPSLTMWLLPAIFLGFYFYFFQWYLRGLRRAAQFKVPPKPPAVLPFSIIIAAHNEEKFIGFTLQDLVQQEYPEDFFEIIVIADRCTDATVHVVREYQERHSMIKLVEVRETSGHASPKRFALQQGLRQARYPFLILMDADCRTSPRYLATFQRYFAAGKQVLVNFPKLNSSGRGLSRYLIPERLLVWGIAAAAVGYQRPFLAFGGSWGYTRGIFEQVRGYSGLSASLSGDDDLLICRMGKLRPPMAAMLYPEGWVKTRSPQSLRQLTVQRRRHHSAGKFYPLPVKLGYLLYHVSNIMLWILPLLYPLSLIFLCGKWILDFVALRQSARIFQEPLSALNFAVFQIGYLLHHILVAPLAFLGKIRWR